MIVRVTEEEEQRWLKVVRELLEGLRYGVVQIVVQDARSSRWKRRKRFVFPLSDSFPANQINWRPNKRNHNPDRTTGGVRRIDNR
jgi:hypothetical protein